ncbi:MAG: hypothetical protein AAF907_07260, partial [Planctomycetota bacterium]
AFAEVGGVAPHRITLDDTFAGYVEDVIGTREVWLGTGPGAFWYAAGPGAKEALESQIEAAAAGGEPSDEFLRMTYAPSSSVDLLSRRKGGEYADYRAIVIDVLKACDGRLTASLRKDDTGRVRGRVSAPPCFLTLLGRLMAEISERENLAG